MKKIVILTAALIFAMFAYATKPAPKKKETKAEKHLIKAEKKLNDAKTKLWAADNKARKHKTK